MNSKLQGKESGTNKYQSRDENTFKLTPNDFCLRSTGQRVWTNAASRTSRGNLLRTRARTMKCLPELYSFDNTVRCSPGAGYCRGRIYFFGRFWRSARLLGLCSVGSLRQEVSRYMLIDPCDQILRSLSDMLALVMLAFV